MKLYKVTLIKIKSYSNDLKEVIVLAENIDQAHSFALMANKEKFNNYYQRVHSISIMATESEYDSIGFIYIPKSNQ